MRKREREKKRLFGRSFKPVCFSFSLFFCLFCVFAKISPAQTNEVLAAQIRSGNTEQKRDALSRIRALRSAEASRLAVPALRDADEIVRATAAFSVIFLPPDEALSVLSPNLNDKSELVRRETAYALGKIRNPDAARLLIRTFRTDQIADVRQAAIVALGFTGELSAIDVLTRILRGKSLDENEFLRRGAARSIGQIAQIIQTGETAVLTPESFLPDKFKFQPDQNFKNLSQTAPEFGRAVPVLIALLENANEPSDVKREAAFALGAIGDDAAIGVLQSNLAAKDYYLAEISRESIRKINFAARPK